MFLPQCCLSEHSDEFRKNFGPFCQSNEGLSTSKGIFLRDTGGRVAFSLSIHEEKILSRIFKTIKITLETSDEHS